MKVVMYKLQNGKSRVVSVMDFESDYTTRDLGFVQDDSFSNLIEKSGLEKKECQQVTLSEVAEMARNIIENSKELPGVVTLIESGSFGAWFPKELDSLAKRTVMIESVDSKKKIRKGLGHNKLKKHKGK